MTLPRRLFLASLASVMFPWRSPPAGNAVGVYYGINDETGEWLFSDVADLPADTVVFYHPKQPVLIAAEHDWP